MRVSVGARDVGQHDRIAMIRLRPRHAVALPITRHRKWIDRIHPPAGGSQARHQQTTAGFDRHRDLLIGGIAMLGEQFQQLPKTGSVVIDAPLGDRLPAIVDYGNIVVVFCPSIPLNAFKAAPFSVIHTEPCWGTRGSNGRTQRSDARSAVHDPSKPQGLSLHISGRRPRVASRDRVPAAGSTH